MAIFRYCKLSVFIYNKIDQVQTKTSISLFTTLN